MDDIELRVSQGVRAVSEYTESLIVGFIRILLLPVTLPLRLLKLSIPPALHIGIFVSLLPLLGLFSLSAGILVSRWLPRGTSEILYLQYGAGATPYAYATFHQLSTSQPYDISVQLTVPKTRANYDLGGNFMTTVTLMSTSNKTVHQAQRPALLVPPSLPGRLLSRSAFAKITIPVFEDLVPAYSTLRAKVEIGRADGWRSLGTGAGKELTIAEAYLHAAVKLRGIRALLAMSPTITALATAATFFGVAAVIAVVLYLVYAPTFSSNPEDVAIPVVSPAITPTSSPPSTLKPALKKRRSSTEIKLEQEQMGSSPLRRRRSILSSRDTGEGSSSQVS